MQQKKTLVMGASPNESRYSHLAVNKLRQHGHDVVAVGRRSGRIADVAIQQELPLNQDIDTITLYLNANNQQAYEADLLALQPKRIIFNPGAENPALAAKARDAGIEPLEACTLVLLSTGQY
ncbi:CoA-binding protein [Niabella terrae]